jgi:chromosome segregation protein
MLIKENVEAYKMDLREVIVKHLELHSDKTSGLKDIHYLFSIEQNGELIPLMKESYEFSKKIPSQVKESVEKFRRYKYELNNIGEVNWFADKDYERQKIRYSFLNDQENELKQSMDDLHNAIRLIDEKSMERFKIAYEEVNGRFSKVFPIIFGGGKANLDLIGDITDPECGKDYTRKKITTAAMAKELAEVDYPLFQKCYDIKSLPKNISVMMYFPSDSNTNEDYRNYTEYWSALFAKFGVNGVKSNI